MQKMKTFTDNLEATAQPVTDDNLILYILGGLGPYYDALVVSVTSGSVQITLVDLYDLLLSHEYRLERTLDVDSIGQSNLMVRNSYSQKGDNNAGFRKNQNSGGYNGGKGGRGHRRNTTTRQSTSKFSNSNTAQCHICSKFGHCPQLLP